MKALLKKLGTNGSLSIVILTVIFGTFQPLIADAQSAPLNILPAVAQTPATPTATPAATPTPTTPTAQTPPGKISGCALWGSGSIISGGDWAQCISDIVYVFTVGIGSGFAYVAAWFFDLTIQLSLNSAAYSLGFISQGWTTARDLGNMAFIFILIYIAFIIMFEAETSGTIPLLTKVIVIALLVNFSFFFTRIAIDAGNILAIQFYNAINAPPLSATSGVAGAVSSTVSSALGGAGSTKDLTASIMGMLNLQGLLSNPSFQAFQGSSNYTFLTSLISLSFLYICAGIMLWLLTIMFASVGVKFLFRIVALWFLIIVSPLAFVAYAIPGSKKYFDQWLSMLIANAFYPVAFMFIFLILVNFSNQLSGSGQNGLIGGIFSGLSTQNTSSVGFVATIAITIANVGIRMGFVIAVLWVGLEASKRIGVMGGDAANHFGSWAGGKMIGTFGAAGRVGVGYGAYTFGQSQFLQKRAAENPAWRALWRGADRLGRSSFDVRSAPGLKSVLTKDVAGEAAGKNGYRGVFDARVKRTQEEAGKLKEYVKPSEAETKAAEQKARLEGAKLAEEAYDRAHPESRRIAKDNLETVTANRDKTIKDENDKKTEFSGAEKDINDLVLKSKQGSKEMNDAIARRDKAKQELDVLTAKREAWDKDVAARQEESDAVKAEITKLADTNTTQIINRMNAEEAKKNLRKVYANAISTTEGNWSRLGAYVPKADKTAADKIRKGKSDADKVADLLKEVGGKEAEPKKEEKH